MEKTYDVVLEHVFFSYNRQEVLTDVMLTVYPGDFICVVGPNGGGKSTLVKLILGLLKPDAGKIEVFGTSPEKARLKIGYMPQYAHVDMKFPVSVMDVVLMGRVGYSLTGRYSKQDRALAEEALREVGLASFARRSFSGLSGGQRQRVLIARALSCQPRLLLLDEPMASIDPEAEGTLMENLQQLNQRMTILLVSHDIGFVSKVVNRVVCVNRQVVIHPTSEIDGEIIKDIYGGDDLSMVRHDHRYSEKERENG